MNLLVRIIQRNPELINSVLQSIGKRNPKLLLYITENEDEFLNFVNKKTPKVNLTFEEEAVPTRDFSETFKPIDILLELNKEIEDTNSFGVNQNKLEDVFYIDNYPIHQSIDLYSVLSCFYFELAKNYIPILSKNNFFDFLKSDPILLICKIKIFFFLSSFFFFLFDSKRSSLQKP